MHTESIIEPLTDVVPWYSGYGNNPSVTIPAGHLGMVAAVDVPCVTRPVGTPATYFTVRFKLNGEYWQASFFERDRGTTWDYSSQGNDGI